MKNRVKKKQTESSMSNASKPICQEEECVGKLAGPNNEGAKDHAKKAEENRKRSTRSSMKFGSKDACSDEECIGKT